MKWFAYVLVIAAMLAAFGYALCTYLDMPYYFESVSTGRCSYLQEPDGTILECSQYDPNRKYIHMYSEQIQPAFVRAFLFVPYQSPPALQETLQGFFVSTVYAHSPVYLSDTPRLNRLIPRASNKRRYDSV